MKFNPDIFIESDKKEFQGLTGRHLQRYNHFFPSVLSLADGDLDGKTVLDCGCNCGFWSIQSLRNGAKKVLGFDGSKQNIDQANFIKQLIGLNKIEYRVFDIMDMEPDVIGQHNITFFLGVLYHLNMPIEALARLKAVTSDFAVVDTTLDPSDQSILSVQADIVHDQNFSNKLSMTPSSKAVVEMLKFVGFKKVWVLPNTNQNLPKDYLSGCRKTFLAKV